MRRILILFVVPLFVMVLDSCVPLHDEHLLRIRRGISLDELIDEIAERSLVKYDVYLDDEDPDENIYDISKQIKSDSKIIVLIAMKRTSSKNHLYYVFAFENDKLIYWGLPIDFKRSLNDKFMQIGKEAVRIIHKDYI